MAGACFASVGAQADYDAHKVLGTITAQELAKMAKEVAFDATVSTDASGKSAAIVTASPKAKFSAQPDNCKTPPQSDCRAFSFFVVSDPGSLTGDQVNDFNASNAFAKAYLQGGKAILMRYEVAENGIPYGNIANNLINFAASAEQFSDLIKGAHAPPPKKKP